MTRVANRTQPQGEPIDALLSAYFTAEMPFPWPACHASKESHNLPLEQARAARRSASWGRMALAASVGLLFVGSWMLPAVTVRRPAVDTSLPILGPGTASPRMLVPLGPEKPGTQSLDKVKSSLHLEQGRDGRTGVKITVEVLPMDK